MKRLHVLLLAIVVLIVGGLIGWQIWEDRGSVRQAVPGQALYERNCAVCHGVRGDGKGHAAYLLQPKPRNFRAGQFRLVSSKNLQPTQEDLFAVITNGMPGTAMPSWAHLAEPQRRELADYVLRLNWEGWVDKAIGLGDSREAAETYANEMTNLGEPIPIPPEPPVSARGLREGRAYFLQVCAKCHGEDGRGRSDPTWRTSEGYPTWSRDLSQGVFKGGREGKQLYLRFFTGLPGTPMPSGSLSGEQVWQVVHYVQSLSDPAAQEQAQIRAKEIAVAQVESLPDEPDDPAWESVPEVRIPLMPLWWHEGYVDAVRVKAVHNGQRLAFLLEWNDTSRDVQGVRQTDFPDGAAVQLSGRTSPPLFAMGAPGEAVNIWHWKALWDEDRKTFQDVASVYPQMVADSYYGSEKGWRAGPLEDRRYLAAAEVGNLIASHQRPSVVEDANAAGVGTVKSQPLEGQDVEGVSSWKDGVWRLQLIRDVGSSGADASLSPGKPASVAFALWDGSAGDRNGQKNVSIWNTLVWN